MFKRVKKTQSLRKRQHSGSDEDEITEVVDESTAIEEMKILQSLRQRTHGVSAESLAAGKETIEKKKEDYDPYKMKTGGLVEMKGYIQRKPMAAEENEQIGTSFAAETNRRDEDADMLKYVEIELRRRKGQQTEEDAKSSRNRKTSEEALYDLPETIQQAKGKKSEDMLSNQMLSGIPEVDLGIEVKIRNIEATEDAKQRLLEEKMRKKEENLTAFVPTNMAVNFVQHKRFTVEDSTPAPKKEKAPEPVPLRVGDVSQPFTGQSGLRKKSSKSDNATDDFHYEKFKKQLRRY